MKVFVGAAALSALVKLALAQGNLIIQTPASLVECQPALLSFSGGQAPYFISALPAGQVSAQPILNLPEQAQAGTYTWNVNLPAGTNISLQIRDGTGALNYGSPVVIQAGTDSSCIDQAAASSATAGGAAATASVSTTVAGSPTAGAPVSSAAGSSLVTTTGDATSATITAASGTPSTTATGVTGSGASANSTGNFTCSQGLLTYGISTASLGNVSLSDATAFFGDLTQSQPTATNVSGTEVMFMVGNISYSFNITMNMSDSSTGSLHQQFEFLGTEPVELGNTTLYDAFEDIQVYTNTTTDETEVQYFILGCFSEQPAGLSILGSIIGAAISSWTESLSNMTTMAAPARRSVKLF